MSDFMPKTTNEIKIWLTEALVTIEGFLASELFDEKYIQKIIRMNNSDFHIFYNSYTNALFNVTNEINKDEAIINALMASQPNTVGLVELRNKTTTVTKNMRKIVNILVNEKERRSHTD